MGCEMFKVAQYKWAGGRVQGQGQTKRMLVCKTGRNSISAKRMYIPENKE